MKDLFPVLAFYVAVILLVSLATYKLVMWVVGGLALGVSG